MSITSYATLQTQVADHLNRTDLTTVIPTFIQLCEANLQDRDPIASVTVLTTLTLNAVEISLPSDFREARSLYFSDTTNLVYGPIEILGGAEQLEDWRMTYGSTAGRPVKAAITAGATKLRLEPTPDVVYAATLEYYALLTALSTSNTSNWLLNTYPNIYLYGTLCEAELYLKNDERHQLWNAKLEQALEQLTLLQYREANAAPLVIRPLLSLG